MPAHDWTRPDSGKFHHFHSAWITHLAETLNGGMLPEGYYAMAEQHAGRTIPHVLTLSERHESPLSPPPGAVAVAVAPPRARMQMELTEADAHRLRRRTLAIRHQSGHRLIVMIEVVSPGNKDSERRLRQFVEKAVSALEQGIHLLVIDLLPPLPSAPQGIHGAIWEELGRSNFVLPSDAPLTLASYMADVLPVSYVEPTALGQTLAAMPLFLSVDWYIPTPLEETYTMAFRGLPGFVKRLLES